MGGLVAGVLVRVALLGVVVKVLALRLLLTRLLALLGVLVVAVLAGMLGVVRFLCFGAHPVDLLELGHLATIRLGKELHPEGAAPDVHHLALLHGDASLQARGAERGLGVLAPQAVEVVAVGWLVAVAVVPVLPPTTVPVPPSLLV